MLQNGKGNGCSARKLFRRLNALLVVSATLIAVAPLSAGPGQKTRLVDYVDPFIGTGGHGHTYPGASVPFGMVQLSPDNGKVGWDYCSGYLYSDTTLVGFSHTHLSGTGCADMGDILFMPHTWSGTSSHARYSHDRERASPGYYSVTLPDDGITVELTATARAGFHRYRFPACDTARIVVDLGYGQEDIPVDTYLKVPNDSLVLGYRYSRGWALNEKIFFAARFSVPFRAFSTGEGGLTGGPAAECRGKKSRGVFMFSTRKDEVILVKVGISYVSIDGALRNLDNEIRGWDFDRVRAAAGDAWENELAKVAVETPDTSAKVVFYTALYHAMLAPTLFDDVDRRYRGADDALHQATGFDNYSTFSLWDTFRAEHPLFTIIQPARVRDMTHSMYAFYRENGYLPVWPLAANETNTMIGYHSIPVLVDAYFKGLTDINPDSLYVAMKKSAMQDHGGLKYYRPLSPVSSIAERPDSTSAAGPVGSSGLALPGYAQTVAGETIGYHSSSSRANRALIVRATDGKMGAVWKTAPLPAGGVAAPVSFVWLAGLASGKGAHAFDLFINGKKALTFHSAKDATERSFYVTSHDGAAFGFVASMVDESGDLFGSMTMTLPGSRISPGEPLVLKVVGEVGDSPDWYMTFEYAMQTEVRLENEHGILSDGGKRFQFVRAEIEYLGVPATASLQADENRPVRREIGPGTSTLFIPVPAIDREKEITVTTRIGNTLLRKDRFLLRPVRPLRYIPADRERESVSKTLEYAYDDWCIAQMAKALGRPDDYRLFIDRAGFYRSVYDSSTGFMRGRNYDGTWVTPFNPRFSTEKQPEYTEGNAWQYLWLVPHDVRGLIHLVGGRARFIARLDSLFSQSSDLAGTGAPPDVSGLIGLYAHGNEPSHHIAYLYTYAGAPWKTEEEVRRILTSFYKPTPDGLCGNEDCGQMSAWYVMSAIGFYPVNPAQGTYLIGSPVFNQVRIDVGRGKIFTVTTRNASATHIYVQSVTLNGKELDRAYITHREVMDGGDLVVTMGDRPSMTWGVEDGSSPPTMSK